MSMLRDECSKSRVVLLAASMSRCARDARAGAGGDRTPLPVTHTRNTHAHNLTRDCPIDGKFKITLPLATHTRCNLYSSIMFLLLKEQNFYSCFKLALPPGLQTGEDSFLMIPHLIEVQYQEMEPELFLFYIVYN